MIRSLIFVQALPYTLLLMPFANLRDQIEPNEKLFPFSSKHQVFFKTYAWFNVVYNLFVILWGAYVRVSFSGAGCGKHWPTCQGEILHTPTNTKTWIELSHRLSSGFSLVLVLILAGWAIKLFPRGHLVRRAAMLSVLFMFAEALLGAALVLFEHVAHNPSLKRALSMSLHLTNTLMLIASLVRTADASNLPSYAGHVPVFPKTRTSLVYFASASFLFLGISGAVAALGDTVFPAHSLAEGFSQDLQADTPLLLRLRSVHPFVALGTFLLLLFTLSVLLKNVPNTNPLQTGKIKKIAQGLRLFLFLQMFAGMVNLGLLAPPAMQLVHLLLADSVWIFWVLLISVFHAPLEDMRWQQISK